MRRRGPDVVLADRAPKQKTRITQLGPGKYRIGQVKREPKTPKKRRPW